jgi:MFS transporter, DHA2 family, multidrug resistance protein
MSETVDALVARYGPGYRWLVTGSALLGQFSMVLSSTSVSVAVPDVMGAFGVGQDQAQWLSTAFFATMVATMLTNAWLVSVLGQRLLFTGTLLLFGLGAVIGVMATSMEFVILARVLQGASAGIVQPLAMLTIFTVFPPERRGTAMGMFGVGVVLAPAFGPALGGIAVDTMGWRSVFLLPLPLCAVALLLGSIFMPGRDPNQPIRSFDWLGLTLLGIALACILNGFASGQREGWHSDIILAQFVIGATASLAFVTWQLMARSPLLDVNLFANLQFASAAAVGFIFGFGMFGSIYITAVFLQTVQSYTATRAGMMMIPGGMAMAMIFPMAGRLVDTIPAHIPVMIGLVIFGGGFFLMATADAHTPFWTFVGFTLVNRLGLALTMTPLNTGALRALRPDQVGQGSGAVNFFRMLGGACGVNLLVVWLELRTRLYSDALTATQTSGNASSREMLRSVEQVLAASGVPEAHQTPGALHYLGQVVYAQANMLGFQETFMAAGIVALCAVVPAWIMGRTRQRTSIGLAAPPLAGR